MPDGVGVDEGPGEDEAPTRVRSTRERLIDAGIDGLRDLDTSRLLGALGTREVARRAGTSSSTFFHHFASLEDYAAAVVERIYDAAAMPQVDGTAAAIDGMTRSDLPFDASAKFHDFEIRKLAADPLFRLRVGLWALGGTTMDDRYGRYLRATEARHHDGTRALWASWGRQVTPPLDLQALVAATVSFLQGATIRWLVDPANMTPERYRRLAPMLHMMALRPIGDRRDLDDVLVELNWWPTLVPVRAAPPQPTPTRDRIVAAAGARFAELEYEKVSVQSIARQARLHVDTLYAYFSTKRALAVAVVTSTTSARLEVDPDAPPVEQVRSLLTTVASAASARPDLGEQVAADMVAARPSTETQELVATLVGRLAPVLDDRDDIALDDRAALGRLILTDTICRQLDKPSRPSAHVADAVLRYHLAALLAPAA
ncbi:TetR/AcrR family transcriptional regulator [Iamia majanohamensis]|uniref:TetR/AcrR family transcriptional regulator n=1 Tax=Iamia majanohamensis TaxID=467976 RepID=A0AAE9Y7Y5_9ACTN|nr:TetR/AcrR family transcriptional regulator [Iamia majanohamensis]WCO65969.1 TetR/AcrR family transcriptional regulator [Iamia majanohamensis]